MEKLKYNFNDIRKEIKETRPDVRAFGGGVPYSDEEIEEDLQRLQKIKSGPEYTKDEIGVSESELQEYATVLEMSSADWFGDSLRDSELFLDGDGAPTTIFPTSEYDDHVNHIDAICVMQNAYSDYKPLPFALDLTYNTSLKLDEKFHWRHPSREIDLPGFCMAKYFEDSANFPEALPKGRIEVMPRFVIGFDKTLSEKILHGQMVDASSWDALKYEEPSEKAKFCVLKELDMQATQAADFFSEHEEDKPIFKELKGRIVALKQYFDGALKIAEANDTQKFEAYAEKDPVFQALATYDAFSGYKG